MIEWIFYGVCLFLIGLVVGLLTSSARLGNFIEDFNAITNKIRGGEFDPRDNIHWWDKQIQDDILPRIRDILIKMEKEGPKDGDTKPAATPPG